MKTNIWSGSSVANSGLSSPQKASPHSQIAVKWSQWKDVNYWYAQKNFGIFRILTLCWDQNFSEVGHATIRYINNIEIKELIHSWRPYFHKNMDAFYSHASEFLRYVHAEQEVKFGWLEQWLAHWIIPEVFGMVKGGCPQKSPCAILEPMKPLLPVVWVNKKGNAANIEIIVTSIRESIFLLKQYEHISQCHSFSLGYK